jgi:nicotinate dehydrogenase subunit A
VLVDGRLARACDLPLWAVENRTIVTPEAPAEAHPRLAAVRRAFADESAGQCGYCLSGMAIAVAALLDADPAPDRAAIDAALARQLCRCGAHPRILRAIARLVPSVVPA